MIWSDTEAMLDVVMKCFTSTRQFYIPSFLEGLDGFAIYNPSHFLEILTCLFCSSAASLQSYEEQSIRGVWLKISINNSSFIPIAVKVRI